MLGLLNNCVSAGLDLFYPPVCQICKKQKATKAECYLCIECCTSENIQWLVSGFCRKCGCPFPGAITVEFECGNCRGVQYYFEHARSAVVATEFMLKVVHLYKYDRKFWVEPFLGELLVQAALPHLNDEWNLIVPVPLHPTKEREREFNQASRLAAILAERSGLELNEKALRRVKMTNTQTALSRKERAENVERAFEVRNGQLTGKCVILIDDVLTTGATTNECAKELIKAGAARVCVWTVLRGIYKQ